MKLDYIKSKKRAICAVLLWLSAILLIVVVVRFVGIFVATARADKLVQKALAQSEADPNDMQKYLEKFKETAEKIKKKNLFAPPPPQKHPIDQVSGILGNEVIIKGKWYKVGDKVGEAKIIAIEPTFIKVEWKGKEKIFAPINAATTGAKKQRKKVVKKAVEKAEVKIDNPVEQQAAAPAEEDPLAWMGVKLSPALHAFLLEKWNSISDEEKEQMKERWNSMSDEQKEQAIEQMEQNI